MDWGAGCNILRAEGERLVFLGQPGFGYSTGTQTETAKFATPFTKLPCVLNWFPHVGPAVGYEEEAQGFSYTPNPAHLRVWTETDDASVTTPAGEYSGCLLLRATQTESPLDADTESRQRENNRIWCGEKWCWFARGVGPVAYRAERADGIVEHAVLMRFECPEQREEWVPLVLGTRWEYVPAEPGSDFDALVVEWLTHVDDEGRWYQAHTSIGNRNKAV